MFGSLSGLRPTVPPCILLDVLLVVVVIIIIFVVVLPVQAQACAAKGGALSPQLPETVDGRVEGDVVVRVVGVGVTEDLKVQKEPQWGDPDQGPYGHRAGDGVVVVVASRKNCGGGDGGRGGS
ncbi:hypothetical protein CGRA01v4_11903 [Colletotrichum graminicola]|nr:hypothetical protein CGRA01v4_11903 [Colletotrichum graminicola]